jgi:mannose-6-phosphate isomerase-like protein (cupin superfamily)
LIFIKDLKDCTSFQAADESTLRELLHPDREEKALQIGFSLAHALFKPGQSTLPHKLKTSAEMYYIIAGKGIIHIKDESAPVHPGQVVYIPSDSQQFIRNTGDGDLTFLCLVSPPRGKRKTRRSVKFYSKGASPGQ